MDDRNFDAFARAFGASASRRRALRILAASAVAAWLPRHALSAAAQQETGCAESLTFCPEQPNWQPAGCYDLASDYYHCGWCEHHCPSAGPVEMACIGGECVVAGCGDLTDCTGNLDCADLGWDPNNCGACGNVCGSGVCEAGVCATAGCGEGFTYCPARSDGQPAGCFDLSSEYFRCGSCDFSCPTAGFAGICSGGQCVEIGCEEGLAYCPAGAGGQSPGCFDLFSDQLHCGECYIQCPATAECITGECV